MHVRPAAQAAEPAPAEQPADDGEEYVPTRIICKIGRKYEVAWRGFPGENTLEPLRNIEHCDALWKVYSRCLLEAELAAAGGDQKPAAKQEESDISEV